MAPDVLEPTVTVRKFALLGSVRGIFVSAEKPQSMTWREVSSTLSMIAELQDDWDGQGAGAPDADVVQLAHDFFQELRQEEWPVPSRIRATPDGCVSFEWTSDSELVFEAEVSQQGVEYITSGPGLPTRSCFVAVA